MFRIFLKTFAVDIAVLVALLLVICLAATRLLAQPLESLPIPPGADLPPPGAVKPKAKPPERKQQVEVVEQHIQFGLFGRRTRVVYQSVETPRLEASRPAIPFDAPVPPPADDSEGPWLPRAEQARVRAMWPKGVVFPSGLLFYDLPRRYQSLFTMNNGRSRFNVPTELEDGSLGFYADDGSFISLQMSGGMAHIPASGWSSVKGLAVPAGKKISVWQEETDVRAFSLVPRWRWRFPVGTIAVDVLVASGKATGTSFFEIRTQTKSQDGWETKVLYKNASAAPAGYRGAGQSCASCHGMASRIVDVPGRIYRHVVWGDDGRFSWRPYREDGTIDHRWPVEVQE